MTCKILVLRSIQNKIIYSIYKELIKYEILVQIVRTKKICREKEQCSWNILFIYFKKQRHNKEPKIKNNYDEFFEIFAEFSNKNFSNVILTA
jgi:hypothetical protein